MTTNTAGGIMNSHPTLTAAMAMQFAEFSEEDCSNPSIHALVRRRLPGRSKRAYQKTLPTLSTPSPPAVREPIADVVVVPGEGRRSDCRIATHRPNIRPPHTCSTQEDASDIDDEAKTGCACGDRRRRRSTRRHTRLRRFCTPSREVRRVEE